MKPLQSFGRARGLMVAMLACFACVAAHAGAASAAPTLPGQDPFYAYSGSLTGVAPGTVLRSRNIDSILPGLTVPIQTTQLLFRTTDELGAPSVAVTTVIRPLSAVNGNLVSWQMAYDGLTGSCDPSYAVQGGTPTEETNPLEEALFDPLLAAGDTIVTTDYEGEGNDFVAGREEGMGTLDGIRAAEHFLGEPASGTKVVLQGYSGGAIASGWATELAPAYAPELDLVGTAMGGIVVDPAHNLAYIDGSQSWAGAIPAAFIGIARSLDINLSTYLNSYGMSVIDTVGQQCLQSAVAEYPGLTVAKLMKPQYQDITQVPLFARALNSLNMADGGTPRVPFYMGVGDSDGTGDGVMVTADDEALAHLYCEDGLPVQFSIYDGQNHGQAIAEYLPGAIQFIESRLAGLPATNGCSSIGDGDSLALLPTPSSAPSSKPAATAPALRIALLRVDRGRLELRIRARRGSIGRLGISLLSRRGRILTMRSVNLAHRSAATVTIPTPRNLRDGIYVLRASAGRRTLLNRRVRIDSHSSSGGHR